MESVGEITELLRRGAARDEEATARLLERVYPDLRRIARNLLAAGSETFSLQVSDVVQESYLRLMDQRQSSWANRTHFYSIVARVMRRIVVDHVRTRRADKRGGRVLRLSLEDASETAGERGSEALALDTALDDLAAVDPLAARLVELRYFVGLSIDEAALVLHIGRSTAVRRWQYARSWLHRELAAAAAR